MIHRCVGSMLSSLGDLLAASMAQFGTAALEELADSLRPRFPRLFIHVDGGETVSLTIIETGTRTGPCVRYLVPADRGAVYLTLSWQPPRDAEAVLHRLPLEPGDPFVTGALKLPGRSRRSRDLGTSCLVWNRYAAGRVPGDHRLLNDLQAMIMLAELLGDR